MFGRLQNETLREVRETRQELRDAHDEWREAVRQDREAFRQVTADLILQIRRMGEEHSAEFRRLSEGHDEMIAEQRAGRQALLAMLDRLPPPPGQAPA